MALRQRPSRQPSSLSNRGRILPLPRNKGEVKFSAQIWVLGNLVSLEELQGVILESPPSATEQQSNLASAALLILILGLGILLPATLNYFPLASFFCYAVSGVSLFSVYSSSKSRNRRLSALSACRCNQKTVRRCAASFAATFSIPAVGYH